MSARDAGDAALRVLVLAPVGRDADVTCELLRDVGVAAHACADLEELRRELGEGAGAILVTSEALDPGGAPALARMLDAQEPWSDLPIIIATVAGDTHGRELAIARIERAGAVTVLERPIRLVTMRTVVQSALRARRRQYEIRDLLEQARGHVDSLRAEQLVRERFVSLLAHDLRGPLSAATLAARVLADRPEQLDQRRELAVRIERSMRRIDRMVGDLLDANRLRAGQPLALDLQPCDLVEIASDVAADLPELERRRLQTSGPDRLEGVWDPHQLRRALWNLVTNALKHGAADGPVELQMTRAPDGVAVAVHNLGPAIPPEELTRIFEPFGRGTGADARTRGWGLGLSLVRGCAEAHGGTVEVASAADVGTTFTLRLPIDARPFRHS